MIFIEKRKPPATIVQKKISIEKTDEWKKLEDGNAVKNRFYFDALDKDDIRKALAEEQHGLCAYCMRKISPDSSSMKIEHFHPIQNKNSAIDYSNFLAVCYGGSDGTAHGEQDLTCDASKKDKEIIISPLDKEMMNRIMYTRDGLIRISDDKEGKLQNEIDHVLQLNGVVDSRGEFVRDNSSQLVANRKSVYKACAKFLEQKRKKYKNEEQFQNFLKKTIESINQKDNYPEYVGVTLFFLKRRIRNRNR